LSQFDPSRTFLPTCTSIQVRAADVLSLTGQDTLRAVGPLQLKHESRLQEVVVLHASTNYSCDRLALRVPRKCQKGDDESVEPPPINPATDLSTTFAEEIHQADYEWKRLRGSGTHKIPKPTAPLVAVVSASLSICGLFQAPRQEGLIMKGRIMRHILISVGGVLCATSAHAANDGDPAESVVVKQVLSTSVTSTGQPITLPAKDATVVVSTYEIATKAILPEHKHPYPRYGYLLSGELRVTNTETGKIKTFKSGDFIIEAIDQWHSAESIGREPVKLLVIDQVEHAADNVILRKN
jgi:quercetin dioxygenase-like cupin family protein